MNNTVVNRAAITTLGFALVLGACGGPEDEGSVGAHVVLIDRTTRSLTSGELESVNGTYGAGCTSRAGAWSVEIAPGATLDNAVLSVVLNDTACVLTLTELRTTGGAIVSAPSFAMTASYQGTASAFGSPVDFYANARLSSVSFAAAFVITVLYSDDPRLATASNTASFSAVQATASGQSVDAPDYTLDMAGIMVSTDVNNIVQSAAGTADLTAGAVAGQRYAVVVGGGLDLFDELDAAYLGATDAAITLTPPAIDFALVGTDLSATQIRTLIISNISNGVVAYQAFEVTFNPAA